MLDDDYKRRLSVLSEYTLEWFLQGRSTYGEIHGELFRAAGNTNPALQLWWADRYHLDLPAQLETVADWSALEEGLKEVSWWSSPNRGQHNAISEAICYLDIKERFAALMEDEGAENVCATEVIDEWFDKTGWFDVTRRAQLTTIRHYIQTGTIESRPALSDVGKRPSLIFTWFASIFANLTETLTGIKNNASLSLKGYDSDWETLKGQEARSLENLRQVDAAARATHEHELRMGTVSRRYHKQMAKLMLEPEKRQQKPEPDILYMVRGSFAPSEYSGVEAACATLEIPFPSDNHQMVLWSDVVKQYKVLRNLSHPDKHLDDDGATQRFQAIGQAYDRLKRLKEERPWEHRQQDVIAHYSGRWRPTIFNIQNLDDIQNPSARFPAAEMWRQDFLGRVDMAKEVIQQKRDDAIRASVQDSLRPTG